MLLSNAKIKYINALKNKKYRLQYHAFIAEGRKIVEELCNSNLICEFIVLQAPNFMKVKNNLIKTFITDSKTFQSISQQESPDGILAVYKKPEIIPFDNKKKSNILILDAIKDPGNMGNIIRTADWFGINKIIVSPDSVDIYNSKTIQSSMGSIANVSIYERNITEFINNNKTNYTFYAATLQGKDIKTMHPISSPWGLIIGSESHGISHSIIDIAHTQITIPKKGKAESLNAAMAAGILLAALTP